MGSQGKKGVGEIWTRYWAAYGGWSELFGSFYFRAAVLVTALTWGSWTARGWWDTVTAVLPNVLGFTLGGYAILLSFGDEKFRTLLAASKAESLDQGASGSPSPYRQLSASFLHFIVIQSFALIAALIAKGLDTVDQRIRPHLECTSLGLLRAFEFIASFVGYLLFVYALFAAIAASFFVFRLSNWFESFATSSHSPPTADTKEAKK